MDRDFLTGLHDLAEQFSDALADRASLARDADNYQAAEVADIAAGAFLALAELAGKSLATERARLEAAVEDAEGRARAAFEAYAWDDEDDARREAASARSALAAFDKETAR